MCPQTQQAGSSIAVFVGLHSLNAQTHLLATSITIAYICLTMPPRP